MSTLNDTAGGVFSTLRLDSKPKLAPKTKLRLDPKTSKYILLYPEKGLLLNPTGAAILKRCTGEHTVAAISLALSVDFNSDAELLEVEVLQFLRGLFDRGLIQVEP